MGGESADAWDTIVDERERLADERGRSPTPASNWRPNGNGSPTSSNGCWTSDATRPRSTAPQYPMTTNARADAGLACDCRARRAQAAVHRRHDAARRADALFSRAGDLADAQELNGEELSWAAEHESFVAHERVRLADVHDELQDVHDELAERREQLADERDVDDRRREHDENTRDANEMRKVASGARARTARARADLQEIRGRLVGNVTPQPSIANTTEARADAALPAHRAEFGRGLTAQFAALTRELFVSQDLAATTRRCP